MAAETNIEWADATFNPWIGCTKVSPACDHCYAEARMDTRLHKVKWGTGQPRQRTSAANWREPEKWNASPFYECGACGWRGDDPVDLPFAHACKNCSKLDPKPARRRVFCASLADVFDNEVPDEWRLDLFDLLRRTPNLDWLLLTKRIGNVTKMLGEALAIDQITNVSRMQDDRERVNWLSNWVDGEPPANIWLGATICNQKEADRDIPKLLATPAAKRFVSIEPMLGKITLNGVSEDCGNGVIHFYGVAALDWVICGGESGPGARPMHPDWPRALRDQCQAAGVPFLFKQWGEWRPYREEEALRGGDLDVCVFDDGSFNWNGQNDERCSKRTPRWTRRVGKKAAGNHLDGVLHLEFPR